MSQKYNSLGMGIFGSSVPGLDPHNPEEQCMDGKVCSVQQGEYLASLLNISFFSAGNKCQNYIGKGEQERNFKDIFTGGWAD